MEETDEVFMHQEGSCGYWPNPNQLPKGLYRVFTSHTPQETEQEGAALRVLKFRNQGCVESLPPSLIQGPLRFIQTLNKNT